MKEYEPGEKFPGLFDAPGREAKKGSGFGNWEKKRKENKGAGRRRLLPRGLP